MKLSDFPECVAKTLETLINEQNTQSIWLIGSRANGNERLDSDWDFIAFVHDDVKERNARNEKVDIIRVDKNGRYLLEGQDLSMSSDFQNWYWKEIGSDLALYTVRTTPDVENGQAFNESDIKYINLKSINIWRKGS